MWVHGPHMNGLLSNFLERPEKYSIEALFAEPDKKDLFDLCRSRKIPIYDALDARGFGFCWASSSRFLDEHLHELLEMLRRLIVTAKISRHQRVGLIRRSVSFWLNWFEMAQPDIVLFPNIPHQFSDYIVYLLAKKKGRVTLFFEKTFWRDVVVIGTDIFKDGYAPVRCSLSTGLDAQDLSGRLAEYLNRSEAPWWTQEKVARDKKIGFILRWKNRIKAFKVSYPGFYRGDEYLFRPESERSNVIFHAGVRLNIATRKLFIRAELFLVIFLSKFLLLRKSSRKRVIMFWQVQPEKSTSPLGARFADQVETTIQIRAWLSKNTELIVKEHPSQLKSFQSLHRGRRVGDYIKCLSKGVKFTSPDINNNTLVEPNDVVIGVTGSVLFEFALQGRQVGVLGYPWFVNHPNIYRVRDEQSFKDFLARDIGDFPSERVEGREWTVGLRPGVFREQDVICFAEKFGEWHLGVWFDIENHILNTLKSNGGLN